MKHYKVDYYNGNGSGVLYVRANSINEAIKAGKDMLLRQHKVGCSVRSAVRITREQAILERHNEIIREDFGNFLITGEVAVKVDDEYREAVDIIYRKFNAKYSKNNPIKDAKRIEAMMKGKL